MGLLTQRPTTINHPGTMPEGSLTTTIRDLEGSLMLDIGELQGDETTGLTGAATAAGSLDTAGVSAQLVTLFAGLLDYGSSVALDQLTGQFPAVKLEAEVASPDEALDDLKQQLETASQAIGGDLVGQIRGLVDTVRSLRDGIPENGTEIVRVLLDQILGVLATLEGPEADTIRAWVQSVEDLSRTVLPVIDAVNNGGDPEALVIQVFQQALSGVLDTFGYEAANQLLQTLDDWMTGVLPATLLDSVTVTADGVTVNYTQLLTLAGAEENIFQTAVNDTAAAMDSWRDALQLLLNDLAQLVAAPLLQPEALAGALRSQLQTALSVPVRDAQRIEDPFTALFDRLDSAIDAVDLNAVRKDVLGFFDTTQETLETLDLGSIGDTLQTALAPADQLVAGLDSGVLAALEQVQAFFDQLATKVRELVGPLGEFQPDDSFVYHVERDLQQVFQQTELAITGDPSNPDAPSLVSLLEDFQLFLDSTLGEITAQLAPLQARISEIAGTVVGQVNDFNAFLTGLDIPQLLEDLRSRVQEILDQLAPIDFAAVIDPVVEEFRANGEKLSQIDPASLNALLKEALKAAIDLVVVINISETVTPGIRSGFVEIRAVPQQAIDQLQAGYEEALSLLDALQPEQLLSSLFSTLDVITQAVETVQPAALLEPLDTLYDDYVQQPLATLEPSSLLEPVVDAFADVTDAFEQFDSGAVVAPLNQLLDRFKVAVAAVDLTAWIDELVLLVSQIQQRLQSSRPSDLLAPLVTEFSRLEQELDRVRPSVLFQPAVDLAAPLVGLIDSATQAMVNALHTMFQAPLAVLDRLNPDQLMQELVTAIDQGLQRLRVLNIPGRFSQLKAQHFDLRAAITAEISASAAAEIEAGGVEATVEAEAAATLAARLALVGTIDPNVNLAPLVVQYRQLEQDLVTLKQNIQTHSVQTLYTELAQQLRTMLPAYGRELMDVETFKRFMRLADPTRFVQELETRFVQLKDKLLPISPEEIGAELDAIYEAVVGLIDGLNIEASLNQVKDSLGRIQGTVAGLRVDFLTEDIDQTIAQVQALVAGLNPERMVAGLDAVYQQLLVVVESTRPSQVLSDLTMILTQVQDLLSAFDLTTLLKEPLMTAWAAIEATLGDIDLTVVLSPLVDKLTELEDGLLEGLEEVETSFDDMLRSARGALGGASASVSVGGG